jgi:pimeloyl-ACP methyl ester carboxylesterase
MTVPARGPREVARPDGGELVVEEAGAGHLLNLERPTRFNEDLLSFLA